MKLFHRLTPLGLVLAASSGLIAQESTGTLVGTIRSEGGKPKAGVRLQITCPTLLQPRIVITNDRGEFRVSLLPPNSNYTVVATADGFVSRKAEGLYIPAGGTIRQDLELKPIGSTSATVEVVALAGSVDKTETKIVTNTTLEQIQSLPTGNLNSYGALAVAPGVSGGVGYPVVRGGLTGQTQFLVNGISVRDPLVRQGRQFEKVIDDLTQDIQVIQSPMNAKYGFTSAGITNIVTKRGTNEFQGSLRVKMTNQAWTAGVHETLTRPGSSPNISSGVLTSYTSPREDTLARTYEITMLGPIWKDHITFAYAGRFRPPTYATSNLTNLFTNTAQFIPFPSAGSPAFTYGQVDSNPVIVGGNQTTLTQQYKLFWQISPAQTLSIDATVDRLGPVYFDPQFGGIDPAQSRNQSSDRGTRGISYSATFGNAVIDIKYGTNKSEVQFSRGPGDQINVGYWRSNAASVFDITTATAFYGVLATNGDPANDPEKRNSATLDANVQFLWENHTFDVGLGQLREITFAGGYPGVNNVIYSVPGQAANGQYLVFNVAGNPVADPNLYTASNALWRTQGRVPRAVVSSTNGAKMDNQDISQALYFNDYYTLNSHWSFMGGLRYEKYKSENRSGTMVNSSDIMPRLTVKYDLFGDNKHVFDLNYGVFRGTIGQGNMGGLFTRRPNNRTQTMYWNTGSNSTPYLVDQATLLNLSNYKVYFYSDADAFYDLDPNLKPEARTSITMNYKRAYTGGFFRASLIFDTFKDMWYSKPDSGLPNVVVTDWSGTGLPSQTGYHQTLTRDPNGKRAYRSLEIEWQQDLYQGRNLQVTWNGNWTMSRTYATQTWREGNVASSQPIFYDSFAAAGVARDTYNPYGELQGLSQWHNIKTWFTARIGAPRGIQNELTFLLSYFSGYPFNLTQNMGLPADVLAHNSQLATVGSATTTPVYLNTARGQFHTQDSPTTIDLQWNLIIPIPGTRVQAFTAVTIYNVFNHFNRTSYQNNTTRNGNANNPATGNTAYTSGNWANTYVGTPTTFYAYVPGWASGDFTYNAAPRNARSMSFDLGFRF
jgi:hypothetical protein